MNHVPEEVAVDIAEFIRKYSIEVLVNKNGL